MSEGSSEPEQGQVVTRLGHDCDRLNIGCELLHDGHVDLYSALNAANKAVENEFEVVLAGLGALGEYY